jgi:hypothetical protein
MQDKVFSGTTKFTDTSFKGACNFEVCASQLGFAACVASQPNSEWSLLLFYEPLTGIRGNARIVSSTHHWSFLLQLYLNCLAGQTCTWHAQGATFAGQAHFDVSDSSTPSNLLGDIHFVFVRG